MRHHAGTAFVVICTTLALSTPAAADVIADWSICAPGIIATGRAAVQFGAGPAGQLDLATVHLAMHDAVQAYEQRFQPYAGAIATSGGSAVAAAARAAHAVLFAKFPAQLPTIDACYALSMTGVVLPPGGSDGQRRGRARQRRPNVLLSRNGDGSFPSPVTPFVGWHWRPGMASECRHGQHGRAVARCGAAVHDRERQRCQPDDPPLLTSLEYAEAYNEVKRIGAVGSPRTTEQGHIARTYSGTSRASSTGWRASWRPRTCQASGIAHGLFALLNTAAADAIICSWHAKTAFNFWRPITAIRNGGADGNPLTAEDAGWTPYMATPNYPDYTSGANNFGGSVPRILELFFGSDKPFDTPFRIYALGGAVHCYLRTRSTASTRSSRR
jgi:hypothetical protein